MQDKTEMSEMFKNIEVIKAEGTSISSEKETKESHWLRLDNAATIYPAAKNRVWDASF